MGLPKIVILTSSLLTDRTILYNNFLPELGKYAEVFIWATAWEKETYKNLTIQNVQVEKFPKVEEMRYWRIKLRRLLDYTWDAKKLTKSRKILWVHTRVENVGIIAKFTYQFGKVLNAFGLAEVLEKKLEKVFEKETRSPESYKRLQDLNPDVVITMSPHFAFEPGVICEARKLKIKTIAYITSWDNITTKNRLMFSYDGFILWSQHMKNDMDKIYPHLSNRPAYIIGAPQYDVFKNPEFQISKYQFCNENNLDPDKPIILYALGPPNLFDEFPGVVAFLKLAAKGDLGDIQVIVRPHPLKHNDPLLLELPKIYSKILIQASNAKKGEIGVTQDQNNIKEWVNTYKYSDVIIQLASTVAIDAAILDKPTININFDPAGKQDKFVKDANHIMDHFTLISLANAVWEVNSYDEIVNAINEYLKNPDIHKNGRKHIAELVCGYTDGKCGDRYADAIINFLASRN